MELAEAAQPGSAVKLRRAPTLVAVSAQQTGDAKQDREDLLATAVAAYIVLLGAHARGLAGYWRTVALLDEPARARAAGHRRARDAARAAVLGRPVQRQRVPERAPLEDFVSTSTDAVRRPARRRAARGGVVVAAVDLWRRPPKRTWRAVACCTPSAPIAACAERRQRPAGARAFASAQRRPATAGRGQAPPARARPRSARRCTHSRRSSPTGRS